MGYSIVYQEPVKCDCIKPRDINSGLKKGDIIQCDDCRTYWRCTGMTDGGMQWDPYPRTLTWERVTPRYGFRNDVIGYDKV